MVELTFVDPAHDFAREDLAGVHADFKHDCERVPVES
jgi:hypothetical protein